MKRTIHIRQAEGGEDSRLFCEDLFQAYMKMCQRNKWSVDWLTKNYNEISFVVDGKNVSGLDNESGGHRIQRIPPTEKGNRTHTSTVSVAVLKENSEKQIIKDSDFKIEWFSGTGAGGQHRNKKQTSCRVTHIPTGLVETRQSRSREQNLEDAKSALIEKLNNTHISKQKENNFNQKKSLMGSGERGDKIRTYRFQDDITTCHISGKKVSTSKLMKGNFELLWKMN